MYRRTRVRLKIGPSMLQNNFQYVEHEPSPQTSPRFGLKTLNRRATFSLALPMLLTSAQLYRHPHSIVHGVFLWVCLTCLILLEGVMLYGIFSAALWTWRLMTNNRDGKPLWNRLATISVSVGLFFAILSVPVTLNGPAYPPPQALASLGMGLTAFLTFMSVLMFMTFACFSYGIGAAVVYMRRWRKTA